MSCIRLSQDEVGRLLGALREWCDPQLSMRARIILMAHQGWPRDQIARDARISRCTVQRWLKAYRERGFEGLLPRKPGKPSPKLADEQAPLLRSWVAEGPRARGVDRDGWTYAGLAEHFSRASGIRVGKSAMREFCLKHGILPQRPAGREGPGEGARREGDARACGAD